MMPALARVSANLLAGLALVAAAATPARAGLILAGQITQISPPANDIQGSDPQSNTTAFIWNERTALTLSSNVAVDMAMPGMSDSGNNYQPSAGTVAAGTRVDTYLLHADPVGAGGQTYDFSVTFDQPILGIIDTISGLAGTDSMLGSPATIYPGASTDRALESADTLVWASNDLTLHLATSSFVDEVRVLVADPLPVPEPATVFSSMAGAAFLIGWAARRRLLRGLTRAGA